MAGICGKVGTGAAAAVRAMKARLAAAAIPAGMAAAGEGRTAGSRMTRRVVDYCREGVALATVSVAALAEASACGQPEAGAEGALAWNESGDIVALCDGFLANADELRTELRARGHHLRAAALGAGEAGGAAAAGAGGAGAAEVLVHLYEESGDALTRRLEGAFAAAVWDRANATLLLIRDAFGVKPLFYASAAGGLGFASELDALRGDGALSGDADPAALDLYLRLGLIPAPYSALAAVRALPPATSLRWRRGEWRLFHYWAVEPVRSGRSRGGSAARARRSDGNGDGGWVRTEGGPGKDAGEGAGGYAGGEAGGEGGGEAEEAVRERLRRLARRAMATSGEASSGGPGAGAAPTLLLSDDLGAAALLRALAERSSRPVRTVYLAEGAGPGAWGARRRARRLARHFGTEHEEWRPREGSSGRGGKARGEGLAQAWAAAAESLARLGLGGEAEDGLPLAMWARQTGREGEFLWSSAGWRELLGLGDGEEGRRPRGRGGRRSWRRAGGEEAAENRRRPLWKLPPSTPDLQQLSEAAAEEWCAEAAEVLRANGAGLATRSGSEWDARSGPGEGHLSLRGGRRAIRRELAEREARRRAGVALRFALPAGRLAMGDLAARVGGFTLAPTLLDRELANLFCGLPLTGGEARKRAPEVVARRALRGLLPAGAKSGVAGLHFRAPQRPWRVGQWLRGPLREWARAQLLPAGAEIRRLADAEVLETLLREHLERRADHGRKLWRLLALASWLEAGKAGKAKAAGAPAARGLAGAA